MASILLRDGSFNLPVITNTQIVIQPFNRNVSIYFLFKNSLYIS